MSSFNIVILSEASSNELAQSKGPYPVQTPEGHPVRAFAARVRNYAANSRTASRNTFVCRSTSSASVCGDISAIL